MLQTVLLWLRNHPVLASYAPCALIAAAALPLLLARRRRIILEKLLFGLALSLLLLWGLWSFVDGARWPLQWTTFARDGAMELTGRTGAWWDFWFFHQAGAAVRAGDNPYAPRTAPDKPLIQHPPTSLPLFTVLAGQPFPIAARLWLIASMAGLLLLAPLVWRLSAPVSDAGPSEVFPWAAYACSILPFAAIWELMAGQMSLWATCLLYAAMWGRQRGARVVAGAALALATVKPATVLPFLLLFLRRGDRVVWAVLAATGLGLCLLGSPPEELPQRMLQNVQIIVDLRETGGGEDCSLQSPTSQCIITVGRWLHCLGLRDRTLIGSLQLLIHAAIAIWLGWELHRRSDGLPCGAGETLVCLFSSICLSHRLYDMVVLVLPLLYCAAQARRQAGWRRLGFAVCVIGLLAVLNMPRGKPLSDLAAWSEGAGAWGRVAQALVLPYAVWVVFFVMAMIKFGGRPPLTASARSSTAGTTLETGKR